MNNIELTADGFKACRSCLATNTKLFSIQDGLEDKFVQLMGVEFSADDGLPQHLCGCCGVLLLKLAGFRERCARSHALLRQALAQHPSLSAQNILDIDRNVNKLTLNLIQINLDGVTIEDQETVKFEQSDDEFDREYDTKLEIETNEETKPDPIAEPMEAQVKIEIDEVIKNKTPDKNKLKSKRVKKKVQIRKKLSETKPDPIVEPMEAQVQIDIDEVIKDKTPDKEKLKSKRVKKKVDNEMKLSHGNVRKPLVVKNQIQEDNVKEFERDNDCTFVLLSFEEQLREIEERKKSSSYLNLDYKCERCARGFELEQPYKNHMIKHDPSSGKYVCEVCGIHYSTQHQKRHHTEYHRTRFTCNICAFVTRSKHHASRHFQEHIGFRYVCKYCGAKFSKSSTHGTHVRVQHPSEHLPCDACGETFVGAAGLRMHQAKAHRQYAGTESESKECDSCGVLFDSSYAKSRHIVTSARNICDPDMRACAVCGENLASEESLREHSRSHDEHRTRCDQCNKSFQSEASLSVHHERVHLQVKGARLKSARRARSRPAAARRSLVCEQCGKKFTNRTMLTYHQRIHTGEKPYACPHCPKTFLSPFRLQTHLRSHTGERPYKCADCDKAFAYKSALNVHKTVHTGEKPYSCSLCEKTFTQLASVHTHVKYVHMKLPAPPRRRNPKKL